MIIHRTTIQFYEGQEGSAYFRRIADSDGEWLRDEDTKRYAKETVQGWLDVVQAMPVPHPVEGIEEIMPKVRAILVAMILQATE